MEDDMDNAQTETSQPEAVVFRSGDIRNTQSKNSPKYFVNVKAPRQKLTKKQKRKIILLAVAIFLAIALLVGGIIMLNRPQPTVTSSLDDDISELINLQQKFTNGEKEYSEIITKYDESEKKWDHDTDASIAIKMSKIHFMNDAGNIGDALASLQELEKQYGKKMSNEQLLAMWNAYRFVYYEFNDTTLIDEYNEKIKNLIIETNGS